jgi:hypothetical protein
MQFANPIWLWALSGLVIPVSIHLLSRKEGKVIYIGSLRHLDESSTKQFRAIRLNEVLLLIMRCILIILTVLFLAGLEWTHAATEGQKWLVIEPGIQKDKSIISLTDSLTVAGYETHYLAADFPKEEDTTAYSIKNYWMLIDQLKSSHAQQVIILSRSYLKDFAGERAILPASVKWITVDEESKETAVMAVKYKSDSAIVRVSKGDAQQTAYEYKITGISPAQQTLSSQNNIAFNTTDTIQVTIAHDKSFLFDATILEASLKAIGHMPAVKIKTTIKNTIDFQYTPTGWIIWLSDKSFPHIDTCNVITYKNNPSANAILYRSGAQTPYQHWILPKRLNIDNALQQHLTTTLAAALLQNNTLEKEAIQADQRTIPESFLHASSENLSAAQRVIVTTPLDKYLILLIALLLLAERLLSYKRNQ